MTTRGDATTTSPLWLRGQNAALDGVRGLAGLAVVLYHTRHGGGLLTSDHPMDHALGRLLDFGWAGVDLFFVLSGFLITGLLCDAEGKPGGLRQFWVRRALRIFPLYYAYLLMAALVMRPLGLFGPTLTGPPGWSYVCYISNGFLLFRGPDTAVLSHLWSLAVEEQFYMLWPLVVLLLGSRAAWWGALAVAVGMPLLRASLLARWPLADWMFFQLPTRGDGLAWGALLALGARRGVYRAMSSQAWTLVALVGAVVFWGRPSFTQPSLMACSFALHYASLAAMCAGLLAASLHGALWARWAHWPWLQGIGRISYGLYVWHMVIVELVAMAWGKPAEGLRAGSWAAFAGLVLAATWATAWLSRRLIEEPFLRLKDRWAPHHRQP